MALDRDDSAASPLVVIATFVLVAIAVTVLVYALFFDRPEPGVQLVAVRGADGSLAFEVAQESGSLTWDDVTLRFVDAAGNDLASAYLREPGGDVDRSDRVEVEPLPPSGSYLLIVLHGGDELSRLALAL